MTPGIPQRVHLVGIGGMHMSAIGRILLAWGHEVSGSDLRRSPLTDALQRSAPGRHRPARRRQRRRCRLVVTTSAATADNPELNEARARGIPVIKRADMVARLMEGKVGVCVAGCHGKSTTSGLVAYILEEAGRDPTYLIGAEIAALGTTPRAGNGPHVVVEADEYDRAFLSYHPRVALVHERRSRPPRLLQDLGGGAGGVRRLRRATSSPGGTLLLCADNAEALALRAARPRPASMSRPTPRRRAPTGRADDIEDVARRSRPSRLHDGEPFGRFSIAARRPPQRPERPRRHRDLRARSASTPRDRRRPGALHAASAAASRRSARPPASSSWTTTPTTRPRVAPSPPPRAALPGRRIVALFQPHTYARTRYLLDGFRDLLPRLRPPLLLETYAAREAIADGMTAEQLAARSHRARRRPTARPSRKPPKPSPPTSAPGDVFFTVGAGDVDSSVGTRWCSDRIAG